MILSGIYYGSPTGAKAVVYTVPKSKVAVIRKVEIVSNNDSSGDVVSMWVKSGSTSLVFINQYVLAAKARYTVDTLLSLVDGVQIELKADGVRANVFISGALINNQITN